MMQEDIIYNTVKDLQLIVYYRVQEENKRNRTLSVKQENLWKLGYLYSIF